MEGQLEPPLRPGGQAGLCFQEREQRAPRSPDFSGVGTRPDWSTLELHGRGEGRSPAASSELRPLQEGPLLPISFL